MLTRPKWHPAMRDYEWLEELRQWLTDHPDDSVALCDWEIWTEEQWRPERGGPIVQAVRRAGDVWGWIEGGRKTNGTDG